MTLGQLTALIEAENEMHSADDAEPTPSGPEQGNGADLMAFAQLAVR